LDLPCEVVIVGVGRYWLALIGFIGIKRGFETAGLICRIGIYYIYLDHAVVIGLFYYCTSQKILLEKVLNNKKFRSHKTLFPGKNLVFSGRLRILTGT
jgi:hypothetical protein